MDSFRRQEVFMTTLDVVTEQVVWVKKRCRKKLLEFLPPLFFMITPRSE